MECPRCHEPMRPYRVDGYLGREVDVDVCLPCQSIWFDAQEHLQLTPGATLTLFRIIGEHAARPAWENRNLMHCPQCRAQLRRTQDLQRNTHFEYFRCPNQHGRLTSFFDFLKEKDFVKPMDPQQLAELRKYTRTINCSNCGAPVDLMANAHCTHCGSALSVLDLAQAERLIEQLKQADSDGKTIDPQLPIALARARQEAEAAFRGYGARADDESRDMVGDGLRALWRLIKD